MWNYLYCYQHVSEIQNDQNLYCKLQWHQWHITKPFHSSVNGWVNREVLHRVSHTGAVNQGHAVYDMKMVKGPCFRSPKIQPWPAKPKLAVQDFFLLNSSYFNYFNWRSRVKYITISVKTDQQAAVIVIELSSITFVYGIAYNSRILVCRWGHQVIRSAIWSCRVRWQSFMSHCYTWYWIS